MIAQLVLEQAIERKEVIEVSGDREEGTDLLMSGRQASEEATEVLNTPAVSNLDDQYAELPSRSPHLKV
jgi:hypothetical protein